MPQKKKLNTQRSKKYPQDPYAKSYRDTNNNQVNTTRGDNQVNTTRGDNQVNKTRGDSRTEKSILSQTLASK